MKEYTYRICSKYKKSEKLLAKLGFNPYVANDAGLGKPEIYATRVILSKTCEFVTRLEKIVLKAYNSKDLDDKDREEYKDSVVDGCVLSDKAIDDLCNTMLCFYVDDGELFLCIDGVEYHSASDINDACGELMSTWLDKGVIYRKKVSYAFKNLKN